jgi:hypothetical protein
MDEIGQEPKFDVRLPTRRWLAAIAAVVVAAIAVPLALHAVASRPPGPPTAAPGTALVGCGSANWTPLNPDWHKLSVRAGALWFVNSGQAGYVHTGRPATGRIRPGSAGQSVSMVMLLAIPDGSTVVLKPDAGTGPYFGFLRGFGPGATYQRLPAGDTGYTLASCPRGHGGPSGDLTDFLLGFSISAGVSVPVKVSSPETPNASWVTFSAPPAMVPET